MTIAVTTSQPVHSAQAANSLKNRVALIDSHGVIVAANKSWLEFAEATATDPCPVGPGVNYFDVCRQDASVYGARKAGTGVRAVLEGRIQSFALDYVCPTISGHRSFHMLAMPFKYGDARV